MDKRHVISLQGQDFVTYEGLLGEAHARGLKAIRTRLLQLPDASNGHTAVVTAEVELEGGKLFTGIGDASPQNVSSMIAKHLIRMAECVPLHAEILTRTGFKGYAAVEIGEEVLAYDKDLDQTVWTPLEAVRIFMEDFPTVRMRSRSFEAICTPDHTWAVERKGKRVHADRRVLKKTHDLKTSDSIIVAAKAEGGNHPLTAEEAALIGWLATDGTVRESYVKYHGRVYGPYPRASIAQSKPQFLDELRELVTATGGTVTTSAPRQRDFGSHVSDCLPQHRFNLSARMTRSLIEKARLGNWEDLPKLVPLLSQSARAAMLDAMLKGDGACRRSNSWVFGQKAKPGVMEAFELLATLEGYALGKPRTSSVGEVPLRQIRKNRLVNYHYLTVEPGEAQPVWCPTTRYGTWVMKLDGVITITGNTRAKARAFRDAVNIGMTALVELDDTGAAGADMPMAETHRAETHRTEPQSGGTPSAFTPRMPFSPAKLATPKQINKVAAEMARVGWSEKDGRDYLLKTFNKLSRSELTALEISRFIDHLAALPAKESA